MTVEAILNPPLVDLNPSAKELDKVEARKPIRTQRPKALIQLQLLEIRSQTPL